LTRESAWYLFQFVGDARRADRIASAAGFPNFSLSRGIAMSKIMRPMCWLAFVLLVLVANSRPANAQGFSFGGGNNQNSNQSNRNNDDEEDKNDPNRQGGRRSQSGNQGIEQFQQFFPGGQGGQGQGGQGQGNQGPSGSNQFRRSNQQGQFQGQQLQNQLFQNWQQGNQNGLKIGGWSAGKWQGSHNVEKWTQAFGGNQQPFSSQWYQDHPKAWKYDNNKSSVWIGGTLPGVYSWLGWGNVPQQYRAYYGNNVQQFDPTHYGEWYPLGVFSLMTGPGDPGTRIVQLAVDQHGHIAGNYYDMITNSNYSLSGDIRQQSQRVSWSLNKNPAVRFRASLHQLLQPYGAVTVQLPGGEQQWQFVRLED
jgi:hypothetical protein